MARIPLTVSNGQVQARATILAPDVKRVETLTFLVDTGSSSVVLSQRDAERLGVDVPALPRSGIPRLGYGGRMDAGVLRHSLIALKDSDGMSVSVPLEEVVVNRATTPKQQDLRQVYSIPSVLGTDVLIAGDLALYAHLNKTIAYLESG